MKLGLSGHLTQSTIRSPLTPLFLLAALAVGLIALLTIPRDNVTHPFAVYRPYDGKWTIWQTQIRETEGVYVVRMMMSPQDPEEILVVSKSGELLFAEQPHAQQPWMRLPPRAAARTRSGWCFIVPVRVTLCLSTPVTSSARCRRS